MTNFHTLIVNALKTILPTHYELTLYSGIDTPCISYMELNNADNAAGDTLGYSDVQYQVKVWSSDISEIQKYSLEVDKKMRECGFTRTASRELYDTNSAMIQKVMTYAALAIENYS